MEVKFIPEYIIGVDKVNEDESLKLLKYIENDTKKFIGKVTKSSYEDGHNLFISSTSHSDCEDNINYTKYDNILNKYIVSYIKELTDKNFKLDLTYYINIYAHDQYAAPHYDSGDFTMIYYCKSDQENPSTSLKLSKTWFDLAIKFNKLPKVGVTSCDFCGTQGDILFFPTSILHWVLPNRSKNERIVVVCNISVEIDK